MKIAFLITLLASFSLFSMEHLGKDSAFEKAILVKGYPEIIASILINVPAGRYSFIGPFSFSENDENVLIKVDHYQEEKTQYEISLSQAKAIIAAYNMQVPLNKPE